MLTILSPSKKLNPLPFSEKVSKPDFEKEAEILTGQLKKLTQLELQSLLGVSDKIAALDYARYQALTFPLTVENAHPALYHFSGDAFLAFDVESLSRQAFDFAQSHLCILSGLYGLLRPLDLIAPYRLEMGRAVGDVKLYDFWSDKITRALCEKLDAFSGNSRALLNLASKEYAGAVDKNALGAVFVTVDFLKVKGGALKSSGFFTKKMRGALARHVMENQIDRVEDIKGFKAHGYCFAPRQSSDDYFLFLNEEEA